MFAYEEQYHQKLKHSCNFDKKTKVENKFLLIQLYIWLTHASSHFQSKSVKGVAKIYITMMFNIW